MSEFGKSVFARVASLLLAACLMAVTFGVSANARFIQPDDWDPTKPGVGTNRYAYAGNDPVNNSDPNGHIFGVDDVAIGIAIGIATIGAFFSSATPANAPGPDDKIETKTSTEVGVDMLAGACVGACGPAVRTGISALKSKVETKKDTTRAEIQPTAVANNAPNTSKDVYDIVQQNAKKSSAKNFNVKTEDDLKSLFDKLTGNAKTITGANYKGTMTQLQDNTTIGLRTSSKTGGLTIDVNPMGNGNTYVVHIEP